jgi:predicted nucleotide-binding protein
MTDSLPDQLRAEANELDTQAAKARDSQIERPLQSLERAAREVGAAWSGSSMGFHATVYYRDFQPPPAGAHFSKEWGLFSGMISHTTGEWVINRHEDVLSLIVERAGNPELTTATVAATAAIEVFSNSRAECLSILSIFLQGSADTYIQRLVVEIEKLEPISVTQALRAQLPSGQVAVRDPGVNLEMVGAPHQEILARVIAIRSSFKACANLATLARQAASHIARLIDARSTKGVRVGGNVFIGHGRSLLWRVLKDFIQDELGLPCDEFNRVPVAGKTTVARLQEMLGQAAFSFLILTAEDERVDGKVTARENVIHETGLFQGRLGFERAIIMLEEGCNEFSNIQGLTQLHFDSGKIEGQFEEVRRVLRREGLIA